MEIVLAKHAGFCFGVRRAVNLAENAAIQYGYCQTWGSLIHNPQEIERLKRKNIFPINNREEFDAPCLVIRAHGAAPDVIAWAQSGGKAVFDATCPFVQKVQQRAVYWQEQGFQVLLVGDPTHPEVQGICAWANRAIAVKDIAAANSLASFEKAAVLSQTTQREENFQAIAAIIAAKCHMIKIENTICPSTAQKQRATEELAKTVEAMIVIGGKNSSNTQKLAQICKAAGADTYCIETIADLDMNSVREVKRLGVTAGASTPDWIIEEVVEQMTELEKNLDCTECEENMEKEICEHADALEQTAVPNDEEQAAYQQPVAPAETEAAAEEAAPAEDEEKSLADAFAEEYGDMKEIRRGARVKGVVVQVKDEELLVDIGGKSEGVLSSSELTPDDAKNIRERFKVGDEIDVLILRRENQEGYPILSKKRVDQDVAWDKLAQMKADKEIVSGVVTEVVKGGVLVDVGLRGFVPASLVGLGYVEDLSTYIGKELQMKIIDCDKHSNKLVLSAKAVLRKASQNQKEKTWAEIAEGQTRHGVVRRLTNFGAFVDIGGVDGLLHVSEMAWYRVNHPADLLKEGDEIDVFILGVDVENEKISLGLKQLTPNPWSLAAEKYPEGSIITAKVMRTTTFGAFLEVEPGVEGLVHISQMAHQRVEKTEDVVKPGDEVQVKVLAVDPEAKRMSLSIKATLAKDESMAEEAYTEEPANEE